MRRQSPNRIRKKANAKSQAAPPIHPNPPDLGSADPATTVDPADASGVGRGVLGVTAHPMPPIPGAVRSVATPNHPKKILAIAAIAATADAVPGPTQWWGQTHGDTVGMKTPLRHRHHSVGGTTGGGATVATEDRTTPETMIRETAMLALLV